MVLLCIYFYFFILLKKVEGNSLQIFEDKIESFFGEVNFNKSVSYFLKRCVGCGCEMLKNVWVYMQDIYIIFWFKL